jgi:hypothetical protein
MPIRDRAFQDCRTYVSVFSVFSLYSGLYNRFDIRACQSRADIGRRYRYQRPRRESSIRQVTCGALFGLPSIVAGAAV